MVRKGNRKKEEKVTVQPAEPLQEKSTGMPEKRGRDGVRRAGVLFAAAAAVMLWGCSGSAGLPENIREQLEETESTGLETADPQEQVQEVLENSVGYQQETIGEEELNQRYYYSLLDAESRQIYRELVQGIREGKEVIVTHGDDPAAVNGICTWVFMDYPEFFWCSGTVETTS